MSALLIIAAVIADIAVYFVTGWRLAIKDLPNAWNRARADWSYDDTQRESVKAQTACMVLCWPILGMIRGMSASLDRAIKENDPQELKRQLDERGARIAELERELGIGDRA